MYKYHVQVDDEPGFTIDMMEQMNTGDYIHYLGYTLRVTYKLFDIDEEGNVTTILHTSDYIEEQEESEEEDEEDIDLEALDIFDIEINKSKNISEDSDVAVASI